MKDLFKAGDKKTYLHKVVSSDFAVFHGKIVHEVYSTFSITRDAEWSSRLFALDMKDTSEEGIGTFVNIEHHAPAFLNDNVLFTATLETLNKNEIVCAIRATVNDRTIATGKTGQKIIAKEKLEKYFETLKRGI